MFRNLSKKQWIYFLLIILIGIAYFAGLFIDVTRDGAKYAYVAKEIADGGNWLNLKIKGEYYTQKPQFVFWLSAASFLLFGISNFAFKLPIFLYSMLGAYAVFRLGKVLYDKKTGLTAALMLLFSVISVLYNMDIHTDIVLQTNVALALWMLYEYLSANKIKWLLGAGLALGLAILTKGPFGLMVPVLAVLGYLLYTRKINRIFDPGWLITIIVALIVSLPAWIFYYNQWGWEGIRFFVWTNTIGRASGSYIGSTTDPTFYIHNLLYLFLPWSLFFFYASFLFIQKQFQKKLTHADQFVFWGIWIPFLLMSLSNSKLPNYIQCIIPLIAVHTARSWNELFANEHMRKKPVAIQNGMIVSIWAIIPVVSFILFPIKNPITTIALCLFLIVFQYFTKTYEAGTKLFFRSTAALTALMLLINFHVSPLLFGNQAQIAAAKTIRSDANNGELIFNFNLKDINTRTTKQKIMNQKGESATFRDENHNYYNYELLFNCTHRIDQIENLTQLDSLLHQQGIWLYADEDGYQYLLEHTIAADTVYTYPHFNLAKTIKYINPKTRNKAMETKYLLYYNNGHRNNNDKKE